MTDKEIRGLAQEYVNANWISESEAYYGGKRQIGIDDILPIFMWISKRYCIVPKEKLDALQDEIHGEIMCAHDDDDWQSVAHYILDVMPRSFNDIFGKDIFKEEKI